MKLISMTDFVLYQSKILNKVLGQKEREYAFIKYLLRTEKYAKFLKQPIKLGMIIPCGERYQNILKEPNRFNFEHDRDYEIYLKTYAEAKEKVLFKGFQIEDSHKDLLHTVSGYGAGFTFHVKNNFKSETSTVELLCKMGVELTESAIKQIGI